MEEKKHPYQIVDPSPWPLLAGLGALLAATGCALSMHKMDHFTLIGGLLLVVFSAYLWWRDVVRESNEKGVHTNEVQTGLRIGMVLFIISELLFFAAFFSSYFYAALMPTEAVGGVWPPKGIKTFDPFHLPYLNTLILLLSGTTVTWAHHEVLAGNNREAFKALFLTVGLGVSFTCIQALEYGHAAFALKDGVYGSNFYMATGFHGLHVIIGSLFLGVCAYRAWKNDFSPKAHVGFEAAAWYWHFVDVVWLFLFISIYWWGYVPVPGN